MHNMPRNAYRLTKKIQKLKNQKTLHVHSFFIFVSIKRGLNKVFLVLNPGLKKVAAMLLPLHYGGKL
jgi:hypothetical protein